MRLESKSGVPCIVINDAESLDDYDVYVNGLRINNGLKRFSQLHGFHTEGSSDNGLDETPYLILIPEYFRDSPDDRYDLSIDSKRDAGTRIDLSYSWSERVPALTVRQGHVDHVGNSGIGGWFKNTSSDSTDTISIYINGEWFKDTRCDRQRKDVGESLGNDFLYSGFECTWPTKADTRTIELRELSSGISLLNTPITLNTRLQSILELEQALIQLRHSAHTPYFPVNTLNNLFSELRNQPAESFEPKRQTDTYSSSREEGTTVVIPVYNSAKELKDCIDSLLCSGNTSIHEILIVDDASPDKSILPYLADVQIHHPSVHVISSEYNRGFVQTVNKGLTARRYNDVIILNSDTVVPERVVDRFARIHADNPSYGVITPLSNNATIFSFPITLKNNPLCNKDSLSSIDKLLDTEAKNDIFRVPTAHGYCMFVAGEVLESVGPLNAEEWGVGYAEENDFCQRVKMAGWEIGAYFGMYVGHVGSTSFGEENRETLVKKNLTRLNELYPEYDAMIRSHISHEHDGRLRRNALQLKYFKQTMDNRNQAIILYASHNLGGGTEEYIRRCTEELQRDDTIILKLWNRDDNTLIISDAAQSIYCEYQQNEDEISQLCYDLSNIDLLDIVFNSTFNFPELLIEGLCKMECPFTAVIHDFSWICPKINMIDARGSFCGMPEPQICQTCVEVSGTASSLAPDWTKNASNINSWLAKNGELLAKARSVICPSQDTASRISQKFPSIVPIVRYHSDSFPVPVIAHAGVNTDLNTGLENQKIAVFGRIGQHKGMAVLKNLIWLLSSRHPGVQIIFFGELAEYKWLEGYKNVKFVGEYEEASLGGMIAEFQPSMALFLSVWPETYCYALTDAIRNGVFPIVFDIGAFRERIKMHNFGALIPFSSDSETIYSSIIDTIENKRYVSANSTDIKNGKTYSSFLRDNMGISTNIKLKVVNE